MSTPIRIPKRAPWITQMMVIRALLEREMAIRFGEYRLGFIWMLLQPIMGVVVIGLVIGSIAGKTVPEIPYAFFMLNGFLLLQLFMGPMNAGFKAVISNQGLTVYPTVKPFDPILARFIYDLLTTLFSLVLFCTIGMWTGMEFSLTGLDVIFAAYFITWLIGCGLGLIFGVMASHYKEVEQVVPVVFRPMMFVSAVFFPTNILPPATRDVYLYNPIVHTIELSRNALFPLYRVEGSNLLYPMVFAIIVLSIGIAYYEKNKYHLSQL